jgi:1-acyl-sn-glycerol-3-phosphate acyltransferase
MNTFKEFCTTWFRRAITFPLYFLLWAICILGFPLFVIILSLLDLSGKATSGGGKKSMPLVRAYLFFLLYLSCETGGLIMSFGIWILSGLPTGKGSPGFIGMNAWLQGWWTYALLSGATRIFSMNIKVENQECLIPGPIILLVRHSSTADTVLAAVLAAKSYGLLLRYVLKEELLWDPCLDVVGNRLPNVFINRSGRETQKELEKIKRLPENMSKTDGILLYPEGTRFHPGKLRKAVENLQKTGDAVLFEKASQMRYVLPPKPGGFLTVLQNAGDVDVVFCAQTGFEKASNFSEFFHGGLIDQVIRIKFHRIPYGEIPLQPKNQMEWLYDQWLIIDHWLAKHLV